MKSKRSEALEIALSHLHQQTDFAARVAADPVRFPRRYPSAIDRELVGFLAAAFAYGRADLFGKFLGSLLGDLGERPALTLAASSPKQIAALSQGRIYRFNNAADVAWLLLGLSRHQQTHGSLERLFVCTVRTRASLHEGLAAFCEAILSAVSDRDWAKGWGRPRGLAHLLPTRGGAFKRVNLFLRWMVRPLGPVDLGVWKEWPTERLCVPLDTHLGRLGRYLNLTRRKSDDWKTVEEMTRRLNAVSPGDPTRHDFVLCHHGMSGRCPVRPNELSCQRCPLNTVCRVGRRYLKGIDQGNPPGDTP